MRILAFVLTTLVVILDQLTKNAILQSITSEDVARPVTSFFNLVLVYNHGISFGMFNGVNSTYQPYVFIAIAAIISVILLRWLFRTQSRLITVAIGLLIGGAVGNSIDRVLHGAVIDFLDFYAFGYHWPSFNIADSAVVCGVGLLLFDSLAFDKNSPQE